MAQVFLWRDIICCLLHKSFACLFFELLKSCSFSKKLFCSCLKNNPNNKSSEFSNRFRRMPKIFFDIFINFPRNQIKRELKLLSSTRKVPFLKVKVGRKTGLRPGNRANAFGSELFDRFSRPRRSVQRDDLA